MPMLKFISVFLLALLMTEGVFAQRRPGPGRRPAPMPRPYPRRPMPMPIPQPRPMPAPARLLACFFEHDDFQGRSFCIRPGTVITNLERRGWNDKISSAIIPRGMYVTVYEHLGFGGQALTLQGRVESISVYGRFWNDRITSIDYR